MNKSQLIDKMSQNADLTKAQATKALNTFTQAVTEELKTGGQVQLTGFCTFKVTERSARQGRNPQTGETIQIAAAKVPTAKMSKKILE